MKRNPQEAYDYNVASSYETHRTQEIEWNLAEFKYLIFDRLSVIEGEKDRLTIQVVPRKRYKAIYPCWFLSKKKFLNYLIDLGFALIDSYSSLGGKVATKNIYNSEYIAFVLEKK